MNDSKVLESLDNVWWFSNALSSRTHQALDFGSHNGGGGITSSEDHFKDTPKPGTTEAIMTPIVQSHQTQITNSEMVAKKCPKSSNLAVQIFEKEERKRSSKRKSDQRRRNIIRGLDFDFDHVKKLDGFWMINGEKSFGYERYWSQEQVKILPALSHDGMAMKEHLKSWAYAVAISVR